ncbi:MAG TPA: tRNA preQ1(34) S-adenosylmethionine ribosyltransferase-isomerase QueA [Sedimentisphaerales bacterium]|nr:tRNA preQ1(34) S-adenosylmethionine ribosyltransferase-isomerase QueA [Sedimentisphaerales bacterium]
MKTSELDYTLPPELIAQDPAEVRSDSRLLVVDRSSASLTDSRFGRIGDHLRPGDCLVLNDTKVLPARFFARRATGGRLEALFLSETATPGVWRILLKGARKLKPDERIHIVDGRRNDYCAARVIEKEEGGACLLELDAKAPAESVLDEIGFPPLPPYIRRDHDWSKAESDRRRYQTVYASRSGAVAAPTAGLHFTEELLRRLCESGVRTARVTLHVGAGTFKPISVENVEDHEIHHEWYRLDAANAEIINQARAAGGRIVAVGTTATRVLETVGYPLQAQEGETNLFVTPGYRFKAVDAMITNFHLPRSTLLALVGAFAGLEPMLAAYRHAVAQRYRFYSYGDAMLIV